MGYRTRTLSLPVYIRGWEEGGKGWGREFSAPQVKVVGLPSAAVQSSFSFNCKNINKTTGDSLDIELQKKNKHLIDHNLEFRFNSCSHEKSHTLQNTFFKYLLGQ